MSERKVLNKYYPPDFDPTKIPRLKGPRNHTFNIRTMAPFNMRCNTCGEYIYKGKKFNSRKETVDGETYLGLYIYRFYIKCPRCCAEIAFKTDPEKTDYSLEAGATRNFEAARTAMELAVKAEKDIEEEELNNPMKVLENRTKASRNEMERLESLEELREMNARHAKVDHEHMVKLHAAYEEQLTRLQDEEDDALVSKAFGQERVKRLADSDSDSDGKGEGDGEGNDEGDDDDNVDDGPSKAKIPHLDKPTDADDDNADDSPSKAKIPHLDKPTDGDDGPSKAKIPHLDKPTDADDGPSKAKIPNIDKPTDILVKTSKEINNMPTMTPKSRDSLKAVIRPKSSSLKGLVVRKAQVPAVKANQGCENRSENSSKTNSNSMNKPSVACTSLTSEKDSNMKNDSESAENAQGRLGYCSDSKAAASGDATRISSAPITGPVSAPPITTAASVPKVKGALSMLADYSESEESE